MEIETEIGAVSVDGTRLNIDVIADEKTEELRAVADVLEAIERIEEAYNEDEPRTLAQTARTSIDDGSDEPRESLRKIAEGVDGDPEVRSYSGNARQGGTGSKPGRVKEFDDSTYKEPYKNDDGYWTVVRKGSGQKRILRPPTRLYQVLYLAAWYEYEQTDGGAWSFSDLKAEFRHDDEVPTSSLNTAAKKLRALGVIEVVGKRDGPTKPIAEYKVTDRGWNTLTEHGRPDEVPDGITREHEDQA